MAHNPVDKYIGQRLRLRRTLLGLSQTDVGKAVGITFQQVQKYERGANRISASRLWDLSQALGVPPSWFFEDMPKEVAASSPARAHFKRPVREKDVTRPTYLRRETLELVRAFYAINDPSVRHKISELVHALGRGVGKKRSPAGAGATK